MAPQTSIPVAANVLGTIGTVFWSIQLVPQVWWNWKQKNTDGLPALMMLVWAISAVPFGVYAIIQNFNIPIQVQAQVFCVLATTCWVQILIYKNKWRTWTASLLGASLGAVFGGVEALLVLTLQVNTLLRTSFIPDEEQGPYNRGVEWPMILIGVISAIMLAGGLIPPYFELGKRGGRVVGINWFFISIDWLGAFFSLMALVAQNTFDYLGGVMYIVCLLLEFGICFSHIVWRLRTRKLHKKAKEEGIDFDELPEAKKYQRPTDRVAKKAVEDPEMSHPEHMPAVDETLDNP